MKLRKSTSAPNNNRGDFPEVDLARHGSPVDERPAVVEFEAHTGHASFGKGFFNPALMFVRSELVSILREK